MSDSDPKPKHIVFDPDQFTKFLKEQREAIRQKELRRKQRIKAKRRTA